MKKAREIRLQMLAARHRIQFVLTTTRATALIALLAGAVFLDAAERPVAPTFLYRRVPDLPEKKADVTTSTCHYKPIFGAGDSETGIVRGVARFGEITVDSGGICALVNYPREDRSTSSPMAVRCSITRNPSTHYGTTIISTCRPESSMACRMAPGLRRGSW